MINASSARTGDLYMLSAANISIIFYIHNIQLLKIVVLQKLTYHMLSVYYTIVFLSFI